MADHPTDETPKPAETSKEARRSTRGARPRSPAGESAQGDDPTGEARSGRLARLGRRILDRGDDVKDFAGAVLETSDRAKSEMVRMVAREVRNYLDELKLTEEVMTLVRSHSLEIHASFSLKPLTQEVPTGAAAKDDDTEDATDD
jgi:hypothetical protein